MRMITESQISRPVPSVQTIRRRRVIKAPKLPAREIGVGREEELGRTSPRNTPEVKEMTGGGGMRRNSVEDRLKKMGILSPGVLGDAVEGE